MKRHEKYKLINYAVKEYNEIFNRDYKPVYKSKKDVKSLLKEYPHSGMCFWSYCCYGLYTNCWQDPVAEGIWGYTQEEVNSTILDIFSPELLRKCRKDGRMFAYEEDGMIHMVIIARDLWEDDYLFTFSKEETFI